MFAIPIPAMLNRMVDRILRFAAAHATLVMAFGLALGLLAPQLAALLGPMLPMVVWVVLFLSMLRIDWSAIAAYRHRPILLLVALVFVLGISPLLMAAVLSLTGLGLGIGLETGLILMAASSPYTAVAAISLILGLDAALALVILVASTLLMPLVLPLIAVDLLALDIAVDTGGLMLRLSSLVGFAVILALVARRLIGVTRLARGSFRIDGIVAMFLLLFIVALMDGITLRLMDDPGRVLGIIALAFAANLGLQIVGALAFAGFGRKLALTVGFAAGNGNLAILLAVLPAQAPPDIALYFALGQFPLFLLPLMFKPVVRRLLRGQPDPEGAAP